VLCGERIVGTVRAPTSTARLRRKAGEGRGGRAGESGYRWEEEEGEGGGDERGACGSREAGGDKDYEGRALRGGRVEERGRWDGEGEGRAAAGSSRAGAAHERRLRVHPRSTARTSDTNGRAAILRTIFIFRGEKSLRGGRRIE
jgi:hypothetical protein